MFNPLLSIKTKAQHYRKHTIVFGLLYGVMWSVILFFYWPEAPKVIGWLDLVSGMIMIFISIQVWKNSCHYISGNVLLLILELSSLAYAIVWTFIIILFVEIDIGEILLPVDAVSLYALGLITMKIWKGDATPI